MEACRKLDLPLIAHFHGYDASVHTVLEKHRSDYRKLFDQEFAFVGVSRSMCRKLIELGAPDQKVHWTPCGINTDSLQPARPASPPPVFIFVGRFTEKKAPHLTILAFARVYQSYPEARLVMIGDGELMGPCHDLVAALKLEPAVSILGSQPHDQVIRHMQQARAYVQHSVTARSGDSEGTPVAVLEAAGLGLPVISTHHAGIPDVISHGETGLLGAERDIETMASHMSLLATDEGLAADLGERARRHVLAHHTMEASLSGLRAILAGEARESFAKV